ncbi:hypothetical protein [Phytobacter diazotrophicus]|uniref:hypothetical protein n=1 Tax=Phytobacter diazotrophicus TaxID=395631 RepID=UPI002FF145B8
MRMTKEQLLDAARKAAKYVPEATADIINELANRLDVTSVALSESLEQRKALAVENNFLLGMAARELNTSWLHNRAMLGMQAALLCLSQGDIKAARDWLEGTTDEAVAEMPDDMTPDGLQLWYDSYMRSEDGKTGFLTREEALAELNKRIPVSASGVMALRDEGINFAASRLAAAYNHGFVDKPMSEVGDIVRMILDAKNDLANDPVPPADGLSGEYAEKSLTEWVSKLSGATSNGR